MRRLRKVAALALIVSASACAHSDNAASAQASAAAEAVARNPASANDGERIYAVNCASCHQADGRGVAGAFPPLAGNPFVLGEPATVIGVVKYGTSGKRYIRGERYDGTMPRWGQMISDDDIAAVVTYIRTSWRNRASAVSLADVRAVAAP